MKVELKARVRAAFHKPSPQKVRTATLEDVSSRLTWRLNANATTSSIYLSLVLAYFTHFTILDYNISILYSDQNVIKFSLRRENCFHFLPLGTGGVYLKSR